MGPVFLKYDQVDLQAWNACVLASAPEHPYGIYTWLRAVYNGKWAAVVWPDGEGGYAAVWPVGYWYKALFLPYILMPPLTQRLELYAARPGMPLEAMAGQAAALLRLRVPRADLAFTDKRLAEALGGRLRQLTNYDLPICSPVVLRQGYRKGVRHHLAQAAKAGLVVRQLNHSDVAWRHFIYNTQPRIPGWTDYHSFAWVRLGNIPSEHYRLEGWEVVLGEERICTACIVHFGHRLIYLMGSTSDAGRETGAQSALITHVLELPEHEGKIFDFEGGNMEGTRTYFSLFGAVPKPYYAVRLSWWD